jgi:hypothetical protein
MPKYVVTAITESRDAFVGLMAWISYLFAVYDKVLVDGGHGKPDFREWEDILAKGGISQDRVQELKNSEINIFDSSYPRTGVFVDYANTSFHRTMRICIKYKIPVWVWWGGKEPWTPDAGVRDHLPTQLEFENAKAVIIAEHAAAEHAAAEQTAAEKRQEEAAKNIWHNINSTPPATQDTRAPKMPIPHPGSRQKYGETPAQFLKRTKEDRTRCMASEDAAQKQRREAREAAQARHRCPGRSSKAPHVFHWEEDIETGIRMRTQVSRAAVDQFWACYSNKQRVFDWYHNEWDVCTEFDPDAKYPDGDDVDDDVDDFYMGDAIDPQPNPHASMSPVNVMQAAAPTLPLASLPAASYNEGDTTNTPSSLPAASYDEDDSTDTLFPVVFDGGLLDILYQRYGFLNLGPNASTIYTNNLDWKATRSILGLVNNTPLIQELLSKDNIRKDSVQSAISHFIWCMVHPTQTIPAALCDIHPESPEPLPHNPHFHIFKRTVKLEKDARPTDVYFVQSVDLPGGMEVMLRDPATVLECYRQFTTLQTAITFLFTNGRPFYTFVSQTHIPQPQPMRMKPSPTLGFYAKDYKPGLREYRHYERIRKEFCSLPRARAALTRGGIIWRLALESIGIPAKELVKNGPSQEVFTHGISVTNPQTSNILWDDELSEEEMDLICGVCQVFTGE